MDQILDFCDETDDFPEGAKCRYTVAQSWSLVHFLRNRCEESIRRRVERMQERQVTIGNERHNHARAAGIHRG